MRRPPTWVANLTLIFLAFLVSLAALEVGLRVTNAAPTSIYEADTTLIYRLAPGGIKTFVHNAANGGGKVRVNINDDGFRGPPLRSDGSAPRVVVYGDSFIEGEFAEDSLTFVRMLQRELSARTVTEVVNAGVVGWGPDQAYLRMQQEVPTMKPQLVVLGIFADNDMGDLVRDRLFRLAADSTLEARRVTLHPILNTALTSQSHPTGWRRLHLVRFVERRVRRPSESLPATRPRGNEPRFSIPGYAEWAMFNATRQFNDMREQPDTVLDLLGDSYDVDVSATPEVPSAQYKTALMDRVLSETAQYLAGRNVPFVILIIPSPIDACKGYDIAVDPARYPHYDRRRISRVIDSMAARHAIRRVDLWSHFQNADACTLYYRGGDLHWNTLGQSIAAKLLADSLHAWQLAQ